MFEGNSPLKSHQTKMEAKQRLQENIALEANQKKKQEMERLIAEAHTMNQETLGAQRQQAGKMAGSTFLEIHSSNKPYLVWLMDHHRENPKYVQLIEFARRKEEEKCGHQVSHGDLRLSTKKESLGLGTNAAASSAPSDEEWSKIRESQDNQDVIVTNLMEQLAETRAELKSQKAMMQELDRRLHRLEGVGMEML